MILDEIKSICLVGNAYNVIDAGLGQKIDDQEYVVRFSEGLPELNPGIKGHIGERTDIWIDFKLTRPELTNNLRCVFTKPPILRANSKERYILGTSGALFKEFGVSPPYPKQMSKGMAFIRLCLKHNLEINICGFTTEDNYAPDLPATFCGDIKRRETNREFVERNRGLHNFELERKIISRLIKEGKVKEL